MMGRASELEPSYNSMLWASVSHPASLDSPTFRKSMPREKTIRDSASAAGLVSFLGPRFSLFAASGGRVAFGGSSEMSRWPKLRERYRDHNYFWPTINGSLITGQKPLGSYGW